MTVDEFLERHWISDGERFHRVETMSCGGHDFKVRHLEPNMHLGFIDGRMVCSADDCNGNIGMSRHSSK